MATGPLKHNYYRAWSVKSIRWMQFWHRGDLVEASHYAREKMHESLLKIEMIERAGTNARRFHEQQDQQFAGVVPRREILPAPWRGDIAG